MYSECSATSHAAAKAYLPISRQGRRGDVQLNASGAMIALAEGW
jgi:hypothetical protein